VIGCIIELIRNNRAYKRRQRQQDEMWMPPKYTESVLSPPVKMVGFKSVRRNTQLLSSSLKINILNQLDAKVNGNGTELQPLTKNEAINSNHSSPPNGSPPQKKIESIKNGKKKIFNAIFYTLCRFPDNSDAELKWEPQGEGAELLGEVSVTEIFFPTFVIFWAYYFLNVASFKLILRFEDIFLVISTLHLRNINMLWCKSTCLNNQCCVCIPSTYGCQISTN
jgi:hypothetical protein